MALYWYLDYHRHLNYLLNLDYLFDDNLDGHFNNAIDKTYQRDFYDPLLDDALYVLMLFLLRNMNLYWYLEHSLLNQLDRYLSHRVQLYRHLHYDRRRHR